MDEANQTGTPKTHERTAQDLGQSTQVQTRQGNAQSGRRAWWFLLVAIVLLTAAWMGHNAYQKNQSSHWMRKGDLAFDARRGSLAQECYQKAHAVRAKGGEATLRLVTLARLDSNETRFRDLLAQAADEGAEKGGLDRAKLLWKAQNGRARVLIGKVDTLVNELPEKAPLVLEAFALGFSAEGDDVAANDVLDRWLIADPNSALANLRRGEVLLRSGRDKEAEASFDKAVSLNPNLVDAHLGLARTAYALENDEKALKHFDVVVRADPQNMRARMVRANLLMESRQFDDSVKDFKWILKKQKGNFAAAFSLASHYARTQQPQKAIDLLQPFSELLPDDVAINYVLANAYHQLEQFQLSQTFLQRHLDGHKELDQLEIMAGYAEANPKDHPIRRQLALKYLKFQWDSAERWLNESLAMQAYDAEVHQAMSRFWMLNGNQEAAMRFQQSAEQVRQLMSGRQ